MKKSLFLIVIVTLGLILGVIFLYAASEDFSGTWIGKTEVPDSGTDDLTLVLKKEKTAYSGSVSDSLGIITANTEIKDIKVEGNNLTFNFPLADGAIITAKTTVNGDKMTGTWEHPEGETGALEFTKKKKAV